MRVSLAVFAWSMTNRLRGTLVGMLVLTMAGPAHAQFRLAPLEVRNISPVVQLYGLPRALGAHVAEATTQQARAELVSTFTSERDGDTFAFFDGETHVFSYRLRGALAEQWEWGVELPYVRHTAGELDGFIDGFHRMFGLHEGGRELARRDRLDFLIRKGDRVYVDFDDSASHIGDVRAFVGRQLVADPGRALAVRAMAKLPTGNLATLSGSGATDLSLWAEYADHDLLSGLGLHLSLAGGVTKLGRGDLLPQQQRKWAGFGHIGLALPVGNRLVLNAQLDAHTAMIESSVPLVAEGGFLGTIGGRVGINDKLWLDVSIIEDLHNQSAADVVFQFSVGGRL